jgi:hypothetical protein
LQDSEIEEPEEPVEGEGGFNCGCASHARRAANHTF